VLLHETSIATSHNIKLLPKWSGPYRIVSKKENYGTYELAELDGSLLRDYHDGSRLKLFLDRSEVLADTPFPQQHLAAIEDDEQWEVEDIVGERRIHKKKQYHVKWRGFPRATWEPVENLNNCDKILQRYHDFKKRTATAARAPY
jgi:hypothetical protein